MNHVEACSCTVAHVAHFHGFELILGFSETLLSGIRYRNSMPGVGMLHGSRRTLSGT